MDVDELDHAVIVQLSGVARSCIIINKTDIYVLPLTEKPEQQRSSDAETPLASSDIHKIHVVYVMTVFFTT